MKKFIFKVETNDGNFLGSSKNWDFDEITREINGTMVCNIKTDIPVDDLGNLADFMNAITLTVSGGGGSLPSAGIDYFSGYIPETELRLTHDDKNVLVPALGHASRLYEMLYEDRGTAGQGLVIDYSATGDKASEIAKDVIDKVRAIDTNYRVNYDTSSVTDSSDTIKDKFEATKAGEALNRLVFLAYDADKIWHWLVTGDNIFHFKNASLADSVEPDHIFSFGYDIQGIPQLTDSVIQGFNDIIVVYNGGATVKRVEDATSIANTGRRTMPPVHENNIPDSATATEVANAHLEANKPPLKTVRLTITDEYSGAIENIDPGDTCQILNLPTDLAAKIGNRNLLITKTIYRKDVVELELSLKHPQLHSRVEHIRRRFEQDQSVGIPNTYS